MTDVKDTLAISVILAPLPSNIVPTTRRNIVITLLRTDYGKAHLPPRPPRKLFIQPQFIVGVGLLNVQLAFALALSRLRL